MKTIRKLAAGLAAALLLVSLSACTAQEGASGDASGAALKVIKIGASPAPHAEILEQADALLAAKGYKLDIQEFTDYIIPNNALEAGELDANFFQHLPYLEKFNKENGTHLVSVAKIHFEPLGIYAGKIDNLSNVADEAEIAVPNDPTNEARALLLLEAQGLIKLKDGVGLEATINDITENSHKLKIRELEAALLPNTLPDLAFAVINGNYAMEAKITDKLIAAEDKDSTGSQYPNVIAVKEGHENDPGIQALVEVMTSDAIRSYILEHCGGTAVPVF